MHYVNQLEIIRKTDILLMGAPYYRLLVSKEIGWKIITGMVQHAHL